MNSNYQVGDLIYDANIYDGMNTDLADLHYPKVRMPEYLSFVVEQAGLLFQLQRMDIILVALIIRLQCSTKRRSRLLKQD